MNRQNRQLLVLNLSEEIAEYIGDTPEGEWDDNPLVVGYGRPDEVAEMATCLFFEDLSLPSDERAFDDEFLNVPGRDYGPQDKLQLDVMRGLSTVVPKLTHAGLVYINAMKFNYPNLILELSTQDEWHGKSFENASG